MYISGSSAELMLASQNGTPTLIGCETNPLGGVTTRFAPAWAAVAGRGVDRIRRDVCSGDVAGVQRAVVRGGRGA